MGRKNANAKPVPRFNIPARKHFLYTPEDDLTLANATIVRYMGEQQGPNLKCWHPDGFEFWANMHNLANVYNVAEAA